jgi:hypothetical protein
MPKTSKAVSLRAFVIIDSTGIPHPFPAVVDEKGMPVHFDSEQEAQLEIAGWMIDKLNEFIEGERDFYDATTCGEFVLGVDLLPRDQASTSHPDCIKNS